MNQAAFSCDASQMLLENDLSKCIEIRFNVKKQMTLNFSHKRGQGYISVIKFLLM